MAALTENRNTMERDAIFRSYPVADGEMMYAGGMAAILNTSGEVEMASDKANLVVIGRVENYVDNTDDGKKCIVKTGCFLFDNSSVNAVSNAHVGTRCYVEDDHTVASLGGTNSVVAGTVFKISSEGVWVDISPCTPSA